MENSEKKTYYTEARARANNKYLKTLDAITIRVPMGDRERYKKAAEDAGKSLKQYIVDCIEADIKRDKY